MILLQEASTHNEEVTMKAKEQFHLYYGADQLILFHKTFLSQEAQSSKANFGARRVRPAARTHARKCDVSRRGVCSNVLLTPRTGRLMFLNLMLRALPRTFRTAWC